MTTRVAPIPRALNTTRTPVRRLPPGWAERIRAEVDRAVEEHPFTPEKVALLQRILRPAVTS